MKRVKIHQNKNILQYILILAMFFSLSLDVLYIYSQEGDAPLVAYKWYYCPRAYPYDTIPGGAFERAAAQREALLQSTGYQFPAPSRWELIGPMPFGYGIGSSGRTHQVIYDGQDPGDPNHEGICIYVTGESGGLWKTIDGGLNWVNKSGIHPNELPTLSAGAFAISYVGLNKILYFGSGDGNPFFGDGRGMRIFKSTDDGISWTSISSGIKPGTSINKIAVSPNDPNTIFAATFHGLYKTTNGGGLWIKQPEIPAKICTDVCFSPLGDRVYAVGPTEGRPNEWAFFDGIGYWRSDDGGSNFQRIVGSGFPHAGILYSERALCAVSKANNEYVWFITFDNLDVNVDVYKSTDHGQNFPYTVVGDGNGATRYQLVLRPSDVNTDICFAGSENLYKTINGGTTWQWINDYKSSIKNVFRS